MAEEPKKIGRPFEKGTTGNPGGRSKVDKRFGEVWDKRSEYPEHDGIEKAAALLADIAFNVSESTKDRLRALELWLNYRAGKPKQNVEVSGGISEDQIALLEALKLTPHERRKAAAKDPADPGADE